MNDRTSTKDKVYVPTSEPKIDKADVDALRIESARLRREATVEIAKLDNIRPSDFDIRMR